MAKRKRILEDVDVLELSIVDKAANEEPRFFFTKAGGDSDDLKAAVDEFLGKDFDLTKVSEAAAAALKNGIKVIQPYLKDLPEDIASAVRDLAALAAAGVEGGGKPKPKPDYGYPKEGRFETGVGGELLFFGKSKDRWPSMRAAATETAGGNRMGLVLAPAIQKSESDDLDDEDGEPVPFVQKSRALRKSTLSQVDNDEGGAGDKEAVDLWPSLG